MGAGQAWVEAEVRRRMRLESLDPALHPGRVKHIVVSAVEEYDLRTLREDLPPLGDRDAAGKAVLDAVVGLGPLQPLMDDPTVEEIWINGPEQVFIARNGISELTNVRLTQDGLKTLVERMLAPTNRRLDLSSPFVDASLPDGSRLHVVIPDITRQHWSVNIRKFLKRVDRLEHLVHSGSLTAEAAQYLQSAVSAGLNIVVVGATQAGKTTMLNSLIGAIGPRERVITVEEVFELRPALRDVVALQTREANLDGVGQVSLRRLVKESLRMRPDRIVVGEVREAESFDLLLALNSGLPGMATLHANGTREAINKLCTLPLLAGSNIGADFIVPTVASSVDLIVHCVREPDGRRHVREIAQVGAVGDAGVIEMGSLFLDRGAGLRLNTDIDPQHRKFDAAGVDVRRQVLRRSMGAVS